MKNRSNPTLWELVLCALFAALTAAGAFVRIPTPLVPVTLQYLFTMLAGLLLGGRLGAVSALCYTALGLSGLPVFAQGGGIGYVLKPDFGYILGFTLGALLTGTIAGRARSPAPSLKRLLAACLAGLFAVYAVGTAYFWAVSRFYLGREFGLPYLLIYCCAIFVPGDAALCVLAALLGRRLIPALRKAGRRAG